MSTHTHTPEPWQAIETTYLGPTDPRGGRVKATANGGAVVTISYDNSLSPEGAHRKAAEALAATLGWPELPMLGGSTQRGMCWVLDWDAELDSMNERAARAFAMDAYRQALEAAEQRDELLEACKRAIPWLGKMVADGAHRSAVAPLDCENALRQAEAAIAKAKGEQHARGRAMIRGDIWECDCPECSKRLTLRHLNPLAFCSSCTTWYSVDWREGDLHGLSRTIAKAKGE